MKTIASLILAMSLLVPAKAEQYIVSSASLKTKSESIRTPEADLRLGVEAIRRVGFEINSLKYTFALKSSAYEKDGKFYYDVALSLSDTEKDNFIMSEKGEMDALKPMNFSFEKDGVSYTAVVNLTLK